ncbi:MAG: penicillin-binding protein activator, partial [Gemmatimonadetes bacterium]|nr:penicillin-binding protein activator [Gemmatimonadota bacterium]
RWALSLSVAASCVVASCVSVGGVGTSEPDGPRGITLVEGTPSAEIEREAAGLLEQATTAFDAERLEQARLAVTRVVDEYPATQVSVDALLLLARLDAREARVDEATAHAERLARLLPPTDDRQTAVAGVRAQALAAADRPAEAVGVLLALPPERAPQGGEAEALVRSVVDRLDGETLGRVLQEAPLGSPLAVPVMLAYATRLELAGDRDGAVGYAQAALDADPGPTDEALARALVEGRALPADRPARIAVVLPLTGSPLLQEFAQEIRDGVDAAIARSGFEEAEIEVEYLDDQGDPDRALAVVREALDAGVDGVIGPLQDESVLRVVDAGLPEVTVISPTAVELPAEAPSVYSLASVDPGAPLALASWASGVGIRQVVVLHSTEGPSSEEARLFGDVFQAEGGSVLRVLTYDPGDTFFRDVMRVVQGLRPDALVLPIPRDDVQAIASQAAFYALDTLGVQLMGTAAWGDAAVRESVSNRYTEGVVMATPRVELDGDGYRAFVEAYEGLFQRSLVDPSLPAAGYDAAALLLRAVRMGTRGAEQVALAVREIRGFAGATGTLSVQDGRMLREHGIGCIQEGALVALEAGQRPVPAYRAYAPNPRTGRVPEGLGRAAGFRCVPDAGNDPGVR